MSIDATQRKKRALLRETERATQRLRLAFGLLQRVSPALAGRTAEAVFLYPRRAQRPAHEAAAFTGARRSELRHRGRPVPLYAWGDADGPVVLFAHGWAGRATQVAPYLQPLQEAGYRVVSYDVPGHGEGGRALVSAIDFTEIAALVARRLGAEVQAAIGHSMGALALIAAAAARPFAERIVAIAPPLGPASFMDRYAHVLALEGRTVEDMRARLACRYAHARLEQIDARALAPYTRAHALVIHDREDEDVPFDHGQAIAAAWPGATLKETRGLGHRRVLRDAEIVRSVLDFVETPRPSMLLA